MHTLSVFIDDGTIYQLDVPSADQIRKMSTQIITEGFIFNDGKCYKHYAPHRITMVTSHDVPSKNGIKLSTLPI